MNADNSSFLISVHPRLSAGLKMFFLLKDQPQRHLDPHNVDNSFDVSQFNRVSAQQLGSNVRTFPTRFANLRQDSVQQVDFSIIKKLRITEKVQMTYRCEFFNSTNRAIFNPPDLVPTSSTFGKITSQANTPRRIQMALRLVF